MVEKSEFPLPPLPLGKPPKLKGIVDTAPSIIRSFIHGIKAIDQSIAAVDNAIKAMDALIIQNPESYSERETQTRGIAEDDFLGHLMKGLREFELAKSKTACPACQRKIDEILRFAEEKTKDIAKVVKTAEEVLEEEGIQDWTSLTEKEKALIKEKIKSRLKEGDDYERG